MIILNQSKTEIVNLKNIKHIEIKEMQFTDNKILYGIFTETGVIAKYEEEERAQEILLDIYSKLVENKNNYRIPEE